MATNITSEVEEFTRHKDVHLALRVIVKMTVDVQTELLRQVREPERSLVVEVIASPFVFMALCGASANASRCGWQAGMVAMVRYIDCTSD